MVSISRLQELIRFVSEKRNIFMNHNVFLKFGTDDGGGSLKVCMTNVYKYSHIDEKFGKLTSVKRILFVEVASNVPESNKNLK